MYTCTFTYITVYAHMIWLKRGGGEECMRNMEQEEQVQRKQLCSVVIHMYLHMRAEVDMDVLLP